MRPILEADTARLPVHSGQDRIFRTPNTIVVLDGATSHGPADLSAETYVDHLGPAIAEELVDDAPLPDALAAAIELTTIALGLEPRSSYSPSSTVAIARVGSAGSVDLLILGDTTIVVGFADGREQTLSDDRLERLDLPHTELYRHRLRQGEGYDQTHREILAELQKEQRKRRNQSSGYWIASTDPAAAQHAITAAFRADAIRWIALATDGVTDTLPVLGVDWSTVAGMDTNALEDLLAQCKRWEEAVDPDGRALPRSKRHDDKAIAVLRIGNC